MTNQEIAIHVLTMLEIDMQMSVADYVDGEYDNDPEMKSIVEDIIIDSPGAQRFYKDYIVVRNSKTDKEWKEEADESLKRLKARMEIS